MFKLSLFLCGIRPVDLCYLKKSDIINGRIEYKSRKCGTQYSIKLEPEALEIIERYPSKFEYLVDIFDHHQSEDGYKNFLKQQARALQNIGKVRTHIGRGGGQLEGLPTFPGITAYWARHTWATLAIELGFSMETVSAGLGHLHGEKVTLVYVAFRRKTVDECNRALIDYILGKKKGRKK
jgi:integrase